MRCKYDIVDDVFEGLEKYDIRKPSCEGAETYRFALVGGIFFD
jgi:hypothetical protein